MSIVNQAKGPLPITATFTAPSDGPAAFVLSGSVWGQSANQMIGVTIQLDGTTIGSAQIWSNGAATHRAVVPSYIPVTLTLAAHKVTLVATNANSISDLNDWFNVVLLY